MGWFGIQQKLTKTPCKCFQLPLLKGVGSVSLGVSVPEKSNAGDRRGVTVSKVNWEKRKITEPGKISKTCVVHSSRR